SVESTRLTCALACFRLRSLSGPLPAAPQTRGRSPMKQKHLAVMAGVSVTLAIGTVFTTHIVHGQSQPPTTIYNPYPTGILPSDIVSELARVEREVDFIEQEAITQWKALPPPIVTGNPPILQNTGVASVEVLGKLMNFDKTISPFNNTACASCHMPYVAFGPPIPSVNLTMIAYPGS